jgi:hypothetical protein
MAWPLTRAAREKVDSAEIWESINVLTMVYESNTLFTPELRISQLKPKDVLLSATLLR